MGFASPTRDPFFRHGENPLPRDATHPRERIVLCVPKSTTSDAAAVAAAAAGVPDAGLPGRVPPHAAAGTRARVLGRRVGDQTVLNLFLELSHGDCTLLLSPVPPAAVVRAVHVATVRVRNRSGALLVETRQLMSDGTVRRRGPRPLSEKMRPGESPEAAAARAVREELGERVRVRILGAGAGAEAEQPRVEERESASYPGLPAGYVLHAVDAEVVEGIPEDGEFDTEETGEDEGHDGGGEAIAVKRHFWEWIDDEVEGAARAVGH